MSKGTKAVSIFGGVALMVSLAACGGSADADSAGTSVPRTLVGDWVQVENGINGAIMNAEVTEDAIEIRMDTRDFKSLYWVGTFDGDRNPSTDFKFKSEGNTEAMAMSLFGSQSNSKTFSYRDGVLSYEFTMAKTTTIVRLVKESDNLGTKKPKTTPSVKVPGTTKSTPKVVTPVVPKAPAVKAPSTKR